MIEPTGPFSGFSVRDVPEAATFYRDVLDLDVSVDDDTGMGAIQLGDGHFVLFYPKGDAHQAASFTVLNLPADDVHARVRELTRRGVVFERYTTDALPQDDDGVMTGAGPDIAWLTDPSGNVFSVIGH